MGNFDFNEKGIPSVDVEGPKLLLLGHTVAGLLDVNVMEKLVQLAAAGAV